MVSFDVVSLFTSIPQGHPATVGNNVSLTTDETMTLFEFYLNTAFKLDGKIYQQVKGTPMGSPISEVIAEAVQHRLEEEVLPRCPPR